MSSFLKGIAFILIVLAFVGVLLGWLFSFDQNRWNGLIIGTALATGNVLLGFLTFRVAFTWKPSTFNAVVVSGIVIRLLIVLGILFWILKFTTIDRVVLLTSLFVFYFTYQVWEVIILNKMLT